jgi:hypothetical protein
MGERAKFIYKLLMNALELQPEIRRYTSRGAIFVSSVRFALVGFVWTNSYFMSEAKAS